MLRRCMVDIDEKAKDANGKRICGLCFENIIDSLG